MNIKLRRALILNSFLFIFFSYNSKIFIVLFLFRYSRFYSLFLLLNRCKFSEMLRTAAKVNTQAMNNLILKACVYKTNNGMRTERN